MPFLLLLLRFLQQQVDEAVDQPALGGRTQGQLLLHLGLQIVGAILAGAQKQLVGRDVHSGAQLHQRFQTGNRAGIFDVGDIICRKVCFLSKFFLCKLFLSAKVGDSLAKCLIINIQNKNHPYKKSSEKK